MKPSNKTILTLDAGGTNLVFKAIRDAKPVGKDVRLDAVSETLEELLQKIIQGFKEVEKESGSSADAISFAFPGPADYERGIIGDLENLPLFRGGVALKHMLENEFHIPVFINNDGDLFALGEAIGGILPRVNKLLKETGVEKSYKNLLAVTLGTGFGGGIVKDGQIWTGDNSAGAEINRMSNFMDRDSSVEEVLSIRGIKRLFCQNAVCTLENTPEPFDIYKVGIGAKKGNKEAAISAWNSFAEVLADAIANAACLVDGLVVIGGGLSGAHPLFLDKVVEELNRNFTKANGGKVPRLEVAVFNLDSVDDMKAFLKNREVKINIPFSLQSASYYPDKKIGVGISKLGTSEAVALGAYAFAIKNM